MIVDLKVHVEIFHYKGRQGSNMRPRESFFQSSRKYFFEGERFSKKNLIRDPAKDKHDMGFAKAFVYSRRMAFADKQIRSTAIDVHTMYVYIYIYTYNVYILYTHIQCICIYIYTCTYNVYIYIYTHCIYSIYIYTMSI